MSLPQQKGRLGRGLASLIGEVPTAEPRLPAHGEQRLVSIDQLHPSAFNPRKHFDEAELAELANSIKTRGLVQPILARPDQVRGGYEIVAGERRWRAAQRAGLHDVPIVPIEVSDTDALEIMIIENVQREDLNAMEEARGYHALAEEFKRSTEDIAKVVGKSRSHVANMMRLTRLPDEVQALIGSGELSAGHARALVGVPDPVTAARQIVEQGLNVRQAEALAHSEGVPTRKPQKARAGKAAKDPDTLALEKRVGDALGLKVSIEHRDPGGMVQIRYGSLDQLDEVMRRLVSGQ